MQDIMNAMNARVAAGEFGNPPNMEQVNAAWSEYLEEEVSKRGRKPVYNNISGLWPENSNKVAFSGRVKDDVVIPSGSKVICFNNDSANEKAPALSLVWVSYED